MKRLVPVLGVAAVVALAGCGSEPPADNSVATLQDHSSSAARTPDKKAAKADQDAQRPRERLDMTEEESDALWKKYNDCLSEHDGGRADMSDAEIDPDSGEVASIKPADAAKVKKAEAACQSLEPLPPWEYDVNNPESADFVHDLVQCLRNKGVKYVEETPPEPGDEQRTYALGGEHNDPESIRKGLELGPECEKEVAGLK